jgi:hypothetical protein
MGGVVARMPLAIVHLHFAEIERRDALEASDVDAELVRVRTALVVGVDAAN